MRETNATGKHAAPPPPPPAPPVREKIEYSPAELRSRRRGKSVLWGLALVVALLLIFALSLRGAAEERRLREHLRAAEDCYAAGDYDDALGHLRQAAAREDSEEVRLRMVDCYESMGNYERALELLRGMDLGDAAIRSRIDAIEQARELVRQAGKISIAGMELDKSASSLILRRTALSEEDLARISELYALSSLSLTEDGLSDLKALSGLGGLTMLDLSGNEIRDLGPLASLGSLRTLYLDKNPITDFSPLYGLEELNMLSIREIEISEAQLAELSQALPHCAIHSETAVTESRELTLGGFTFSEDVTELGLSNLQLTDISALSACRELLRLNLAGNALSDLTPLMDLPYLEELNLSDNQVADLRPLMAMRSLQHLELSDNAVSSIAPLATLSELRELSLRGNAVADLAPLRSLTALETLDLENTGLTDEALAVLAEIPSLRNLNLRENPALTGNEVDALKRALPQCEVTTSTLVYTVDINGERRRMDVTELDISGAEEVFPLAEIWQLQALEKLRLSGDGIKSIYDLGGLKELRELDLSDNEISDVTALAYMTKLEKLNLSNNPLGSVAALLNLTQLQELDVRGTGLTPEQLDKLASVLKDCTILHD